MQPKLINPYSFVGTKHKEALDFIIANLPADPTFEQLNEVLRNAIFPDNPANPLTSELIGVYLMTVLPNAYNGYVSRWTGVGGQETDGNTEMAGMGHPSSVISHRSSITCHTSSVIRLQTSNTKYTDKQLLIINYMMEGIKSVPVENIGDFLRVAEEKIVSSGLTYEEQLPLFIATASGISDWEYWNTQIETPGAWAPYLTDNVAFNYWHVAGYVSAAMQGALLTYGLIKPPQIQFADVLSSMTGSVGLVAGKVVFGWY